MYIKKHTLLERAKEGNNLINMISIFAIIARHGNEVLVGSVALHGRRWYITIRHDNMTYAAQSLHNWRFTMLSSIIKHVQRVVCKCLISDSQYMWNIIISDLLNYPSKYECVIEKQMNIVWISSSLIW